MQNLAESAAITFMSIVVLACIGKMLDIAYNVFEDGAVCAWRWLVREVRINVLRCDIHGYDVDMAYLMKEKKFNANAYCSTTMKRHAAVAELASLLAEKQS